MRTVLWPVDLVERPLGVILDELQLLHCVVGDILALAERHLLTPPMQFAYE